MIFFHSYVTLLCCVNVIMYQRVPVPNGLLLFHLDSHPKQLLLLLWQQPSMQRTAALGVQPGAQCQSSFHVICGHLAPWQDGYLHHPTVKPKLKHRDKISFFQEYIPYLNLLKHTPRSYQKYHCIFIKSPQKIHRHKITMLDVLRYPYPYPIPSYH